MGDEIGSAAELFDVAELREVVMHHLGATCEAGPDAEALGLPPELLYAPGSPDEPMAMDLRSRVGGLELGVSEEGPDHRRHVGARRQVHLRQRVDESARGRVGRDRGWPRRCR